MLVAILENLCWPFPPANGAPVPALMRLSLCEEALAGSILHPPPSLWLAWVCSGCAGALGGARPLRRPSNRKGLSVCRIDVHNANNEGEIHLSLSLPLYIYMFMYTHLHVISVSPSLSVAYFYLLSLLAGSCEGLHHCFCKAFGWK